MGRYTSRCAERISQIDSHLCVGIDPRPDLIDGDLLDFLKRLIDETEPYAAAYKPNAAYFEAMGSKGIKLLEDTLEHIPEEVPTILDVKRSDIGETQSYYAKAYFDTWNVDAVTLNPLLGFDSIEPFLEYADRGVYLLAITSNRGANDFLLQSMNGKAMFEHIQDFHDRSREVGYGCDIGLVAGLTNLEDALLERVADLPLLIPGLGAQGGDLTALAKQQREAPILINASRGISFKEPQKSFAEKAKAYRDRIREALA